MSSALPTEHHEPSNAELLVAIHDLTSMVIAMNHRLNQLEAPPTKSQLIELVRERDARIALKEDRIAELEARVAELEGG